MNDYSLMIKTLVKEFPELKDGSPPYNELQALMDRIKFNSLSLAIEQPDSNKSPLTVYSNPTMRNQNFPFRKSMMNCLVKNASEEVTKKLYKSCKQLYSIQRAAFCHSLYACEGYNLQYFCHSMATDGESEDFEALDKLRLTNTLIVRHSKNTFFSQIRLKLDSCNIRFLRISGQNFSVAEYNFLTESKTIMKLVFQDVSISDENGNPIILEHFLYQLPQAMYIDAPIKTRSTPQTKELLFAWEKPQKIHCISVLFDNLLMDILNPTVLFEFLSNVVVNVRKSTSVIQFEKDNPRIREYLHELRDATLRWKLEFEEDPPKVLTLKVYEPLLT
jgi:hypothetical protein